MLVRLTVPGTIAEIAALPVTAGRGWPSADGLVSGWVAACATTDGSSAVCHEAAGAEEVETGSGAAAEHPATIAMPTARASHELRRGWLGPHRVCCTRPLSAPGPAVLVVRSGHDPDDRSIRSLPRPDGVAVARLVPARRRPAVAGPGVAGPRVARPAVAGPAVARPRVPRPAVARPGVAGPRVARPRVACPAGA